MLAKWIPFYGVHMTEKELDELICLREADGSTVSAEEMLFAMEETNFATRLTLGVIALIGIALAALVYRS